MEYIVCTKEQHQDFEREHMIWNAPIEAEEPLRPLYFDNKMLIWMDGLDG